VTLSPSSSRGSGGGGSVNSVTAADTSIVVAGTATDPTIATATLDVIAADHPPAAAWSNNSKKITNLANGSAAQDAAAFGQIPTTYVASVAAGDASIVVGGTAANPTLETGTLDVIAADHPPAAAWSNNSKKITGVAHGAGANEVLTYDQVFAAGAIPIADIADPTTGKVIGSSGGAAAAVFPPGYEIAYNQITAGVNITGTNLAGATAIIAGSSHTYLNVPYLFVFFSPIVTLPSTTGGTVTVVLTEDGTAIANIAYAANDITGGQTKIALIGQFRYTPSAGSHTYAIAAYASATTGTPAIGAAAGGSDTTAPAFLRVTQV